MITIKTKEEIEILREGGKRLAFILQEVARAVKPGVSTKELNNLANKLAKEKGDIPSSLNYKPKGAKRPYPASICVSINDEIVHGIPNENPKILKEGDIVSLDMCLTHKGLVTDSAITVPVGKIDSISKKLIEVTKEALYSGIKAAKGNKHTGDIGYAVERVAKANGFSIVEDLCGHGVGYSVHEDPYIPNYGERGRGDKLKPGMIVAIEPMLNEGEKDVFIDKDGYTFKTADSSRSAHFEHTIVITSGEPEILTRI
ncbi:MAG: type I methionyl aminopeptidase [Candidatus Paceibacterota bacterium]|jgi:methionyl aminopeptidase